MEMTGETSLTAYHTPSTNLCTACQTNLSRHHRVLANFTVVGYLYEIVKLDTLMDNGLPHGRTVNTSVGANLNIVLDNNDAQLWNLLVALLVGSEAKTIGSDDTACVNRNVLAYLTTVVDGNMGIDARAVANPNTIANACERANVDAFTNLSRWRDKGQGIDASLLGQRGSIHLHQLGHTLVGVLDANERGTDRLLKLQILVYQYDAGLSIVNI